MIDIFSLTNKQIEDFIRIQSEVFRQQINHDDIIAIREYYDGEQTAKLTRRQEEFINLSGDFGLTHNMIGLIVDTITERISLDSITNASSDLVELWAGMIDNGVQDVQTDLYKNSYIDGESFLIVDYDPENDKFILRNRVLDDGKNGVVPVRDHDGNITMLSYYWHDFENPGDRLATVARRTVYLPHEIRKYKQEFGAWVPVIDDGDESWPIDWTMPDGSPIGIPLISFDSKMRKKVISLAGLQDSLNKSWADLIAVMDQSGFPILTVHDEGFISPAESDINNTGADELKISPGRMLRTSGKIERIESSNLNPMIDGIWNIVLAMASVSKVPHYYLRHPTQEMSADGLRQLEKGLSSLINTLTLRYSRSWNDLFEVASKMRETFGPGEVDLDDLTLNWRDSESRNDLHDAQIAHLHRIIGIPAELVIARIGYSIEDIERFGGFNELGADEGENTLGSSGSTETEQDLSTRKN